MPYLAFFQGIIVSVHFCSQKLWLSLQIHFRACFCAEAMVQLPLKSLTVSAGVRRSQVSRSAEPAWSVCGRPLREAGCHEATRAHGVFAPDLPGLLPGLLLSRQALAGVRDRRALLNLVQPTSVFTRVEKTSRVSLALNSV